MNGISSIMKILKVILGLKFYFTIIIKCGFENKMSGNVNFYDVDGTNTYTNKY